MSFCALRSALEVLVHAAAQAATKASKHFGMEHALQAAKRGDAFGDTCTRLERQGFRPEEVVMALVILGSNDADADSRVRSNLQYLSDLAHKRCTGFIGRKAAFVLCV